MNDETNDRLEELSSPDPQKQTESSAVVRWRLILGRDAIGEDGNPIGGEMNAEMQAVDQVLEYLFDREHERDTGTWRPREGSGGDSTLTVPTWLGKVRTLFPKSTAEQLTHLALDRYGLTELLADEKFLETVTPNLDLLRALISAKDIVPPRLRSLVRRYVQQVVGELLKRMTLETKRHFSGAIDTSRPSSVQVARNFDPHRTIRKNLKNFEPQHNRLRIEKAYFHSRIHRQNPWEIILLVDQSGSMLDAMIHSAILASIFKSLPNLRTHLVVFDTSVVDLSEEVSDPVEILMRLQLGGGTDIAQAMRYGEQLIRNPRRSLIVLITDFFEGGSEEALYQSAARLTEAGVTLLGLAALDDRAEPAYHKVVARRLSKLGMDIAAMTPDRLAEWVAAKVRV